MSAVPRVLVTGGELGNRPRDGPAAGGGVHRLGQAGVLLEVDLPGGARRPVEAQLGVGVHDFDTLIEAERAGNGRPRKKQTVSYALEEQAMILSGRRTATSVLGLALVLGLGEAMADPVRTTAAPTVPELKNATYSGLEEPKGPVTLKDGRWEGPPSAPGGKSRPTVTLGRDFRVVGDLDGDGADEAVVVLAASSSGSGSFDSLAVVKRTQRGVENVATAPLGDRVQIRSARIEDGKLLVSVVRAGPGDALCCPGELADLRWTLAAGKLAPVGPPRTTGRLLLQTLAGTEWVLRSWDLDEPALAGIEVTLAYQQGAFGGTSGCNRYTAAAAAGGDVPGSVTVSPPAATRMACPERPSAVEARFLKQLGGAKTFGFLLGRLALSYEREGGGQGTMLFDGREQR
jgi:heat shock protein HslJ